MTTLTRTQLDEAMGFALLDLALCSHVSAPGYEPKSRSCATKSVVLAGGDKGNQWAARKYGPPFAPASDRSARNDGERSAVLEETRAEIRSIRGHGLALVPRPDGETLEQLKHRIVTDGEGWTVQDCSNHFHCTGSLVRTARRESGRLIDLGHTPPAQRLSPSERRQRAKHLHGNGLGVREIARRLGEHPMTISRDIAKEAA